MMLPISIEKEVDFKKPDMYTIVSNHNMEYLKKNQVYLGRSENLMKKIEPETIALSFWSPPYFVGKEYEKGETFETWQNTLRLVVENHVSILKPGGFMVVNIADILCFPDEKIPRYQGLNIQNQKSPITKEMVLKAKKEHPEYGRYKLAELLGCSEQTVDRRINGNNIRGGKYQTQTRVKLVGAHLEEYAYNVGLYLYDKRIWAKDPAWANSKWTTNTLKAVSEYEDLYIFWKPGEQIIDRSKLTREEWKEWGYRGIWYLNSVRANDEHEAQFPVQLAERVIRLFSEEGEIVLDPFFGGGTTGIAAINQKRDFIGIEKEEKYVKLSKRKIKEVLQQPKLF